MSSLNAPSVGASESGSSRRHSIDTNCHPAAVRCPMISELNGPEITSRIRSKCAIRSLRAMVLEMEYSQFACQNQFCSKSFKSATSKEITEGQGFQLGHRCPLS